MYNGEWLLFLERGVVNVKLLSWSVRKTKIRKTKTRKTNTLTNWPSNSAKYDKWSLKERRNTLNYMEIEKKSTDEIKKIKMGYNF